MYINLNFTLGKDQDGTNCIIGYLNDDSLFYAEQMRQLVREEEKLNSLLEAVHKCNPRTTFQAGRLEFEDGTSFAID